MAIAWSMADPELLLSCGKDAKILCSNPNTGEVLYAYHFKKTQKCLFRGGTCKAHVPVLAFQGVMPLWDVAPYPICYMCVLSLFWWWRIPSWYCQYYTFVLAASLSLSNDVPVHYKRWKWLHLKYMLPTLVLLQCG